MTDEQMVEAMARALWGDRHPAWEKIQWTDAEAEDWEGGRVMAVVGDARAAFSAIAPELARLAAENARLRDVAMQAAKVAAEMSEEWRCGKAAELMDALTTIGNQS